MLPFCEPQSHERAMFCFLDRDYKVSGRQVADRALLRKPIGTASDDRHLFEGVQRERRDRADVARNLIERFFNKVKQCRRGATRYDKLAANYLAFVQLASIRLWLRVNEYTA
jgi:transposase